MTVADLADTREVAVGRREAAAGVLHRLQEDRCDRLGSLEEDRLLDCVGRELHERLLVLAERVAEPVRVHDVHAARRERLEGSAECRDARDRERSEGRAVVRGVACDDLVALPLPDGAEVLTGELPRRLDGFRPSGREEDAVEIAGSERGEPSGELDRRRVRVGPDREVAELLPLGRCGGGEPLPAVTGLHGEEAREAVEEAVVVLVVDVAAFATGDYRDVVVIEGRQAGEVHPQMALRDLLHLGVGVLGHRYLVPHV